MSRINACRLLMVFWSFMFVCIMLIITVQSVGGAYGDDSDIVWGWFITAFSGPMTLVTAAAFGDPSTRWKSLRSSTFRLISALVASLLAGGGCLLALLIEPLLALSNFELLRVSAVPIALVQGLAVAAMASVIFEGR